MNKRLNIFNNKIYDSTFKVLPAVFCRISKNRSVFNCWTSSFKPNCDCRGVDMCLQKTLTREQCRKLSIFVFFLTKKLVNSLTAIEWTSAELSLRMRQKIPRVQLWVSEFIVSLHVKLSNLVLKRKYFRAKITRGALVQTAGGWRVCAFKENATNMIGRREINAKIRSRRNFWLS